MASVTNPTDNTITVTIRGNSYTVGPKETIHGVPEQDANDWKANTHAFIEVGPNSAKTSISQAEAESAPKQAQEPAEPDMPTKAPVKRPLKNK